MDFLTKKELNGLKGDIKASEIAIKASNEDFKKKLIEQYGKEINFGFVNQTYIPPQSPHPLVFEVKEKLAFFLILSGSTSYFPHHCLHSPINDV